jgi:tetratricopeptide (TPR) repeat protein
LQETGIAIPQEIQGISLASAMVPTVPAKTTGGSLADRPIYSESDYPHRTFGWSELRSLRTGKYLFVDAPRKELYDQSTDPKAEHDLSGTSTAVTNTLTSQLDAFHKKTASSKEAPKANFDPELQEKLAALGYMADNSASPMPGIKDTGADPKDKVQVVNLMHEAEIDKEEMRFQEAAPLLEKVIAIEPNLPIAYLQLGTAYTALKNYEKAVPVLQKAVEMRPDLIVPRYQLGAALFETGDFAGSAKELETVVERSPQWGEARFSLATAYARMDRLPDAIREYQKVIEVRPKHYGAHLLLGRALALTGKPEEALAPLQEAAQLQPNSPEPHRFLADAYTQLGRNADAEKERGEAQRLSGRGTK